MGLAAGQARLLSITGRKSDCEFESMRLSHQKIALARELADLSNEYQNSLNQTKLIYDYYGTGDTSTQLSYGILMYPSALNNYMPTLITDALGRVTLNSKYALAARAAGIPQEGLGTLPSEDMRNAFINGLAAAGLITKELAEKIVGDPDKGISGIPYNQGAGFGGGSTVAIATESGNIDKFLDYLNESGATINITLNDAWKNGDDAELKLKADDGTDLIDSNGTKTFNLGDLIGRRDGTSADLYLWNKNDKDHVDETMFQNAQEFIVTNILDQVDDCLTAALGIDDYSLKALEYARSAIQDIIVKGNVSDNSTDYNAFGYQSKRFLGIGGNGGRPVSQDSEYIGWTSDSYKNAAISWFEDTKSEAKLDISNMLNAYLTYFADYMNGISKTTSSGIEIFDVNKGEKTSSHLATNNKTFEYVWKIGSEVSSDDLGQATFYDALFNQICANGWTENDRINENDYLQQMLQNGMMFISRMKDDNYYYQGNYATDTYIKEIADETLIAYAESKYNTEKAKLNAKEETLDMKMKNLDTEISSLTTEYDTVKNTISKNIEKSFKRYSA